MREGGGISKFWRRAARRRAGAEKGVVVSGDGRNRLRPYLSGGWEVQLMLADQHVAVATPPTIDPPELADELRAMRRRSGADPLTH